MNYTLHQLRIYLKVTETLSITKTAEKLNLTQPAISIQLKNFQDQLLQNVVLRGIKGINKVILRKIKDNVVEKNGLYKREDIWVLDTVGTNLLEILGIDYIDNTRTYGNDIVEI
jgi:predicted transcriptional regulator